MDEMAVRLRGVGKRYRHFSLAGGDLAVARGRSLGVVGQNGAGKSTLLRIVMGPMRADAGSVEVLGLAMPAEERAIKTGVGFVSEDLVLSRGDDVAGLADEVAFIHAGQVVDRGPATAFAGGGRSIEEAFVSEVRGGAGRAA